MHSKSILVDFDKQKRATSKRNLLEVIAACKGNNIVLEKSKACILY